MLLLVVVQGLLLGNSDGTGELPRGTVGAPAVAGRGGGGASIYPGRAVTCGDIEMEPNY